MEKPRLSRDAACCWLLPPFDMKNVGDTLDIDRAPVHFGIGILTRQRY